MRSMFVTIYTYTYLQVGKLLDTVEHFVCSASSETCVWIDWVAINQHVVGARSVVVDNTMLESALESVLHTCVAGTIVVVDMTEGLDANPAKRGWCIFEWDQTIAIHGLDGLHMEGLSDDDRGKIVQSINVANAKCVHAYEINMILSKVQQHYPRSTNHESFAAFDTALKLQLLLQPLSYKVDMQQLQRRSADTQWRLQLVEDWVSAGQSGPRALCVMAGSGTGKSTISAALCTRVFHMDVGPHDKQQALSPPQGEGSVPPAAAPLPPAFAAHFLKYNDQRRLEPLRILQSLAFQLASRYVGHAQTVHFI